MADGTAFATALEMLAPNAKGAELRAIFDHKLPRSRIAEYRLGRRKPPAWVTGKLSAMLERSAAARLELAAQIQKETGPGKKAGAHNLAVYLARRR